MDDDVGDSVAMHEDSAMKAIRKALEEPLREFPSFGSRFTLQRWLEEYDSNIETITSKLRWVLNTLSALGASRMDVSSIQTTNEAVSNATHTAEYFPGGFMGYDREGNVILAEPLGRVHSEEAMRTTRISDFYKLLLLEGFATHQLVTAQEERYGCRKGQIMIIDFDGFSRHVIYIPGLPLLSNAYGLLQLAYPGIPKKIYIVNAPSALAYAFGVVQVVLSKRTRETIEFVGTNWRERLRTELGEENLLPFWGGTLDSIKPTGYIRMAGPLPDCIKSETARQRKPRSCLTLTKASAKKAITIPIQIARQNTKLKWYFECDGGDIDFCIRFGGKEVVPRFRLNTSCFPEFGELECKEAGTYDVCFDNKHAKLWNKSVFYKIETDEGTDVLSERIERS